MGEIVDGESPAGYPVRGIYMDRYKGFRFVRDNSFAGVMLRWRKREGEYVVNCEFCNTMETPLYQVRTYDADLDEYTPQIGLDMPWQGLTLWQLKRALQRLRELGYSCHRFRDYGSDEHSDNDTSVLVERMDQTIERWQATNDQPAR